MLITKFTASSLYNEIQNCNINKNGTNLIWKTFSLCQSIFVQCECVSYLRTICFYAYRKPLISKPKFTQIRIRLLYNELSETVEAVKSNNNFVIWKPQKWSLDLCSKKAFICACIRYYISQVGEESILNLDKFLCKFNVTNIK